MESVALRRDVAYVSDDKRLYNYMSRAKGWIHAGSSSLADLPSSTTYGT